MPSLIATIGAILAFFIVVVVHEYGHFIVARVVGIKVIRFSIGFGKPIFKYRTKSGVEFVIGWLPLGGYVKMQDAFSEENLPGSAGDAFESKSLLARMAVVLAGPAANILLAFVLFSAVYTIGITHLKPIIGSVTTNSIAAKASLKPQDQIVKLGNTAINNWQQVVMFLIAHIGDQREIPILLLPQHAPVPVTHQINLKNFQFDSLKPDVLSSFGITPYFLPIPPVIALIAPDSPAAKSDLRAGDLITQIDEQPIRSWQDCVRIIEKKPLQAAIITIQRQHHVKKVTVVIGEKNKMGFLGIMPKPITVPDALRFKEQYPWYFSFAPAYMQTKQWVVFHLVIIKQMLLGRISLKTLGGPVSIFQSAGSASLAGLTSYLQFIALISVVLGVLNIMPIPALDGGHFLFFVIEGVMQKPLPLRLQVLLINCGVIFLVTMMLYATLNDLIRLLH